jgi:hypothetical protein
VLLLLADWLPECHLLHALHPHLPVQQQHMQ